MGLFNRRNREPQQATSIRISDIYGTPIYNKIIADVKQLVSMQMRQGNENKYISCIANDELIDIKYDNGKYKKAHNIKLDNDYDNWDDYFEKNEAHFSDILTRLQELSKYGYNVENNDNEIGGDVWFFDIYEISFAGNKYENELKQLLQESGVIKLPSNLDLYKVLTEAGIEVENKTNFKLLDEANQLRVTDDALTSMMKFITDKYNSIDFSEIEKSAGSYTRFKYAGMIDENLEMLANIYKSAPEAEAKKYIEVISACYTVREHLIINQTAYSTLYKQGNGLVQLMYTSLVAAIVYCIGTLVSNTIRFVTTEKDTDCEVLFDEIPGSVKHIHIKNILAVSADIGTFNKLLNELAKPSTRKGMNESISLAAVIAAVPGGKTALLAVGAVAAVIYLAPRVLWLIREIIYSIYFTRVKVSDMLGMQADLIRTNIESLEAGRGNKKVIARQRKIADKLEKWKNKIAVKMDTVEQLKNAQTKKEDRQTRVTDDKIYSPEPNNNLLI